MKLNSKDLEKLIRNNIDLESNEFIDKLLVDDNIKMKNKKKYLPKFYIAFVSSIIIVFFITMHFNLHNNQHQLSNATNIININHLDYNNGKKNFNSIIDSGTYLINEIKNDDFIDEQFKLKIPEFSDYTKENICYFYSNNSDLSYCNIKIFEKDSNILLININLKKDYYPLFIEEKENMWEQNILEQEKSIIYNKEIFIIGEKNYPSKVNYKTKFKVKDIFLSIETFNLEQHQFISILENILK